MNNYEFKSMLKFGKDGEEIISKHLIVSSSVSLLPLYQFEQGLTSPKIETPLGPIIAPDLMTFKSNKCLFVECKRKTSWVKWQGELETGINESHYNAYRQVCDVTGNKCLVFFLQELETPLGIYFVDLEIPARHWNGLTPEGKYIMQPMALWNIKELKKYS